MLMRMQSHRTSLDTDTGTLGRWTEVLLELAACKALAIVFPALSPCVLVQPDGWARGSGRGTGDPAT